MVLQLFCKYVSLNNNKKKQEFLCWRVFSTNDNFTPFPSFMGVTHTAHVDLEKMLWVNNVHDKIEIRNIENRVEYYIVIVPSQRYPKK